MTLNQTRRNCTYSSSCSRSPSDMTTTLERSKPTGVELMMIIQMMMIMMMASNTDAFSAIESPSSSFRSASSSFFPPSQSIAKPTFGNRRLKTTLLSSLDDEDMGEQHDEYGTNMNQDQMMESDMLIVVDQNDRIVDLQGDVAISKKKAHTFTPETPRGILHRAFSLFVFDSSSRLLLTQRASTKITFPSVWTNTACSHPLVGMESNKDDKGEGEVDVWPDCYPAMDGIKRAAVRKARHELGLDLRPYVDGVKFVSRFHYWASDVATHGNDAPWGEHELDYVLMVRLPVSADDEAREEMGGGSRSSSSSSSSSVTPLVGSDKLLDPNPDEVGDLRFVTVDELKCMLYDSENKEKYTWSPWFVGIMERGGFDWWEDLDNTLQGKNTNTDIAFFDPPVDFVASYNHPDHDRSTGILLPAARQNDDQRRPAGKRSAAQLLANSEPKEWVTIQGG
eukprot:CAMPEP_0113476832 /NCGR_PEP_ID=MMETSP0014_2-20120614/19881_1 /TAXON_ID=2857 /ORGANISM="Nitzschia sp." /LENGTH=450 /DNA_ID=CAMNT_0000369879 /DNA_START=25 /DNA_END=1377 /DNA_ORIENTATION=- /assembly_acc=CAM_ASM_000159